MEFIPTEVRGGGAKLKGAGGSQGSGSAAHGSDSSSSAAVAVAGVSKRRKVDYRSRLDRECGDASADSTCVVQFERCEVAEEEVNSPAVGESFGSPVEARMEDERCFSEDVEDPGSASCCSTNESSELAKKTSELVDLVVNKGEEVDPTAVQSSFKSERVTHDKEAGADSDENNTPKPPAAANSHRRQLRARMPTQDEIDEFFSAAEADTAVRIREKYNFDFEKEEPLKGRYEWQPLISAAEEEEKIIKA